MGSSPGFVSNPSNYLALLRLAFAAAPSVSDLTWPLKLTRWLILQKARRQDFTSLRPVVSIRFQILFHSPRRGSFHLSLTVLVRYRSSEVFSLGRWSSLLPTGLACPVVLRLSRRTLPPPSTGLSPSAAGCSKTIQLAFVFLCRGLQPHRP